MTQTTADKRRAFRALHEAGCFVIPNPWDVGSALALQSLGFKALASTSAGMAWSMGEADGKVGLDQFAAGRDSAISSLKEVLTNGLLEKSTHDLKRATAQAASLGRGGWLASRCAAARCR